MNIWPVIYTAFIILVNWILRKLIWLADFNYFPYLLLFHYFIILLQVNLKLKKYLNIQSNKSLNFEYFCYQYKIQKYLSFQHVQNSRYFLKKKNIREGHVSKSDQEKYEIFMIHFSIRNIQISFCFYLKLFS